MDKRILEQFLGIIFLFTLVACISLMILFAMDAEQKQREREIGEFTISRSSDLFYKMQYERSPE